MKRTLFLLLGTLLFPNITFGYSYYSYFSTTTINLQINNTINVIMPQNMSLCSNDSAFDNSREFLKYLDSDELETVINKVKTVTNYINALSNWNFYTTERVKRYTSTYSYHYENQQVYDSNAYNQAVQNVCNAQQDVIDYITTKYNNKVTEFNNRLKRIGENIQNWDNYANNKKYEDAIRYYEAALTDLNKLNWVSSIISQIENAIKELKASIKAEQIQKLNEQYLKALNYAKEEYYDWAIKELEDLLKNEWKIERDNYEETKHFLEEFKKWKELYWQDKKAKEQEEELAANQKVAEAKAALGSKAAIFDSLVPLFKAKDQKTQENVKALLKTFEESKDAYTRNIGIYFGYLVK